ncbi:glycosyltransferase family 92 domain-containing protein [Ditylenchus destructor]|uniref:Glycosyltransferase family 92 protein n=1 Tax=Ditylenchus destructor TaxID=166010 RepID=A0AAD4RCG6_9BILA|nr:glycosyltransferase family 92 domain-containing protein [Ditylenchus destructor]
MKNHKNPLPTNNRRFPCLIGSGNTESIFSFGTRAQDVLVVLFVADLNHDYSTLLCTNRDRTFGQQEILPAKLDHVRALGTCHLEVFVLRCFLGNITRATAKKEPQLAIGFREKVVKEPLRKYKGTNLMQLSPSTVDREPRQLVICMSRIFAFEKWQLLLTAMEVYRFLKVDLVVTYVNSVLSSIYALMKAYEREGRLLIKPGIKFPYTKGMQYDPNMQTEFNSQILLAHECFYTFRESADFIALIDWDDLLVTAQFPSLGDAFHQAAIQSPNVAYFMVNKLESTFNERERDPRLFSIRQLISQEIRTAHIYNDEKMVVRPTKLRGFWMHNSEYREGDSEPVHLTTNYSLMLHLANEERVPEEEFNTYFLASLLDLDKIEKNLQEFMGRREVAEILQSLPRSQPYFDAIYQCHKNIFIYYKAIHEAVCLSYALCNFPKVNAPCTIAESRFESKKIIKDNDFWFYVAHLRTHSGFKEKRNGCVD